MILLLDSHAFVWALHAPEKLASPARAAIESESNEILFSSASVWELVIKTAKGRLQFPGDWIDAAAQLAFTELPVRGSHALALRKLPAIHQDPFDRMLIAQAQTEGLTVVTRDRMFAKYQINLIEA